MRGPRNNFDVSMHRGAGSNRVKQFSNPAAYSDYGHLPVSQAPGFSHAEIPSGSRGRYARSVLRVQHSHSGLRTDLREIRPLLLLRPLQSGRPASWPLARAGLSHPRAGCIHRLVGPRSALIARAIEGATNTVLKRAGISQKCNAGDAVSGALVHLPFTAENGT